MLDILDVGNVFNWWVDSEKLKFLAGQCIYF